jgi:hypothetical protein
MLTRRSSEQNGVKSPVPLQDCAWQKKFPTVAEFLCQQTWQDGAARLTGTITLLFEDGIVKAALNDRDGGCSAFVSARTFTSLWEALEKGLAGDGLEWRVKRDPPLGGPRKKG